MTEAPSHHARSRPALVRALALLLFLSSAFAHARPGSEHPTLDPHHVTPQTGLHPIDLTGNWLVHEGDDPSFASPTLDDRQWLAISTTRPLASDGITHPDLLWYRTHVHLPPGVRHLGVLLRDFRGSAQIFVNGVPIGTSHFPSGGLLLLYDQRSPIPDALLASGDLTIAVRASIAAGSIPPNSGGFISGSALLLGDQEELAHLASLFHFQDFASNVTILGLTLLLLLIAVALALTLPQQREYLALVVFLAGSAVMAILSLWRTLGNHDPTALSTFLNRVGQAGTAFGLLEFSRIVLGLRRSRLMVLYAWTVAAFFLFLFVADQLTLRNPRFWGSGVEFVTISLFLIASFPTYFLLPPLALWVGWRRRNRDALLFFFPLLLQSFVTYTAVALFFLARLHLVEDQSFPETPFESINMGWPEVADFLFLLALLVFLILRTVRIARALARDAAEFEAAHSTQQLLLARASEPIAGFEVQTVYLPAREVGGDFFLVSPAPDGGLTAIVGDVSGKGLTAALRVSLILGVLRRESSRDPATILTALNQALLTQGEMGFTTACCVLLSSTGHFTIANAGHLSPYLANSHRSAEVPTTPALPLGITPDQTYGSVSGQLLGQERLVLLSDGIPEARSASGELFGFDRLPNLLHLPAQDIASVAQRFGQEDDITVLTVACTA